MKPRFRLIFVLVAGLFVGCKGGESTPKVDVSAATKGLKSSEVEARVNACTELAKAGPGAAAAVPDLIPLIKDPDPLVRRLAVYALGQIGPKASSAIPAIKESLNDRDNSVVQNAVIALRAIDPNAPKDVQMQNTMTGPGQ